MDEGDGKEAAATGVGSQGGASPADKGKGGSGARPDVAEVLHAHIKAAEAERDAAEARRDDAEARLQDARDMAAAERVQTAMARAEAASLRIRLDLARKALGALQSCLCDSDASDAGDAGEAEADVDADH